MKLNKRIIAVMTVVLALFLILVIYLTHFIIFKAPEIIKSSYNPRVWEKETDVLRGEIYDRSGTVLAKSEQTGNNQTRIYPYGKLYAHTIGYNSRNYGKTNIELEYNDYLLDTPDSLSFFKKDKEGFENGANLTLTLDNKMTELAANLLGKDNGSVVAINPKTGEVYCLYSNPSFDPNESALIKNWDSLTESADAPFFFRATQGQYAPGSTFKVVTAAAAIEKGYEDFTTDDKGKTNVGGKDFKNAGETSFGEIGMKKAIAKSSNVYFTEISQKIGNKALGTAAAKFYITKKVPFDINTKTTALDFDACDSAELASVAIGQGKLAVSPFNMAVATCAIANDGVVMKPYLVEEVFYDNGDIIYSADREALSAATDKRTAKLIKEYMVECVATGTGTAARVSGITVAGKTGTAENEREGKTHAWFIGFAPADNPQIAICVMKEYSGRGGGSVCAPVAGKIINYALKNGLITK